MVQKAKLDHTAYNIFISIVNIVKLFILKLTLKFD